MAAIVPITPAIAKTGSNSIFFINMMCTKYIGTKYPNVKHKKYLRKLASVEFKKPVKQFFTLGDNASNSR